MNKVLGSQLGARIGARLSRAGRIARIAVRMNNPARAATQAKYTEGMKGGWERGKKIKPYVKYGGLAGLTYGMYRMGKLKMPGSQEREESMAYSSRNHNMTKYDKYVDLYKAARMDELEKDLYSNIGSSVARLGGKLAGSRAGSKVARGFTRFAGTKLGSKVRQYTPHIMAGAGALAGGLTASKLMARRKQKEQESQNVGKPGVNINMSQSNVDLFKLDNKQLVNRFARRMSRHFRLHGGKYGVGAGAFAMGRASKQLPASG